MLRIDINEYPFFKWVGFVVCCSWFLKFFFYILKKVYHHTLTAIGFGFNWQTLGEWAVITGGTDGIGKAYAEELARKGFHICIISRNLEKLYEVASQIDEKYNVSTKIIKADFTKGPEIYEQIKISLSSLDGNIGILVNNVGMSYKYAEYFHSIPNGIDVMHNLIYSNITSCTMMTRLVLPSMIKKQKGVIINISSLMAIYPMPLLTAYSACKAYVDYFSRTLQHEYKDKNIIIQSVLPAYVATKMSKRKTSLEIPSAATYASSAIKTVGIEACTYGYLPHKIRGFVHEWLKKNMPASINFALSMYFMNKSRERYFKKMQLKMQNETQQN